MAGGTGIVLDERMLAHDPGPGHPERPDRLRVLHAPPARRARTGSHRRPPGDRGRDRAGAHAGAGRAGRGDGGPAVRRSSIPTRARRPARGRRRDWRRADCSSSCEAVLAGEVENGVALVRPPGHHAERARAMGFCLFNNVAIAAAHLRRRGVARVLVVDWDLHHGNGTQHIFEHDPDVLYVSTHQYPYYPGTGAVDEVGDGAGAGRTLNLPFPGRLRRSRVRARLRRGDRADLPAVRARVRAGVGGLRLRHP